MAEKQIKVVTLHTDVDGLNKILAGLDAMPHNQVRPLIDSIVEQANAQLTPATATLSVPHEEEVE